MRSWAWGIGKIQLRLASRPGKCYVLLYIAVSGCGRPAGVHEIPSEQQRSKPQDLVEPGLDRFDPTTASIWSTQVISTPRGDFKRSFSKYEKLDPHAMLPCHVAVARLAVFTRSPARSGPHPKAISAMSQISQPGSIYTSFGVSAGSTLYSIHDSRHEA